ncbi:rab11 family-interacting protein 1 isoform X1 [Malaclemys terrapin pileata]|uniref:rab11 family-interacting protein 1 isoform X1 n=1 Tax=Malaclemys terrapin pileata TaxID=2991368 RepID=UPI0023A7E889|nr:rab11 family-interacting protein 1 isoform X1 [Malaclemys terrapin pileata]
MSLSDSPPRWAPTHVQVTVLRARGLRPKAKGAGGGSDAYALMALGKEKFATSVSERCLGSPVWREEATFELPPRRPGHGGEPALQLTVLHRALLGLDKFLGRAEIRLAELQEEGGRRSTRWYTLHSKPGKKEKERGEIEVDIQFMRSNMTASMFDLSMKDKSRSPFGKLKGKLKGKRANGLPDTASAIIPSITHSPADSEEESPEKEKKKSKIKTLFSKPGLQKTSLSQSMSVLPGFQPATEKVRLKPGDFQAKWGEDDDDESFPPNSEKAFGNKAEDNSLHVPVLMAHKRTASADNKQLNEITSSNTKKEGLSLFSGLKSKNDPTPRSNVCINGNHVYRKESETKKETMSKDNTPSSSPQTFRKNQPSESEENLSSKYTKEHEKTGRMSPSRGLSGSHSLESFKSMTLPSYKLLSGGDLLGNSASLSLETEKEETKEDKKQENKKSALLSLVTGRKEVVKNSDVENMSDMTLKEREAKLLEEKKNEKEVKPVEIPKDYNQESTPKNSNTADIPRNKKSHNPFDESLMEEEQKPDKSAASARTIQTKAVKPRLGVSSEDETEATLPTSVPDSLPAFLSAHHSSNDNNPFTSKLGQKIKARDSSSPLPPSLISGQRSNDNAFISDWEQESKAQDSESFTSPLLYFPHPPATLGHVSSPLLSTHLSIDNNPFVSKLGQESKVQDLKSFTSPPSFSLPSAVSSKSYCSFAINFADSEHPAFVSSEESQNESLTNDTNTVSNSLGSLSESSPLPVYERVGQTPKKQCDAKEVQIVSPDKKNNSGVKKSVTFHLDELEYTDSSRNHAEALDREQRERWHPDPCEEMFTTDPTITEKREGFASVLGMECYRSSKLCDESRSSVQNNESTVQDDIEASSTSAETWMKDGKELTSLSKSNYSLSPGNAVIQPSSAESKLNEEQELYSGKKSKHSLNMEEFGLALQSKVTHAIKSDSSVQVEPPKPTPRVHTLLPKDPNMSEDVSELNPLFAKSKPAPRNAKPKPTPRNAVKLDKCAPVSLTGRLKDEELLTPSDSTMSGSGFVFHRENPMNPHENPAGDSLLKTATRSTTHHLDRDDSNNGPLKHKTYGHDDSLFDSGTDLKSAIPVTGDQSLTHVGLPVIPEVGSDDELLDSSQKNNEMTAIYKSFPNTENQCIDSLSVTEVEKLSSGMGSTDRASILLQKGEGGPEDTFKSSKSSKLNSIVDIHSASSKTSESGLDILSYPSEHGCGVEEQELKESSSIKESRKSDFFESSEKSVSFTSLSSSSQLSLSSSSPQTGSCDSSRAESVKKPPAESFNHKVENAGKKKVLRAWVSPSETLPNQTQQSGGSVSVKHRPHPVKPMNTTANKSHTKNLTPTTKMDENWTESNRKKYDPSEPAYAYAQLTHDELIQLVLRQKDTITKRDLQVRELENYIDNLLVRVMEETPNILRAPSPKNKAGRM